MSIANFNILYNDIENIDIGMGSGSIVMLLAAIGLCCVPFWSRSRWKPAPVLEAPEAPAPETPAPETPAPVEAPVVTPVVTPFVDEEEIFFDE